VQGEQHLNQETRWATLKSHRTWCSKLAYAFWRRIRIARLHYGAEVHILCDPNDLGMDEREKYTGNWRVRGAWKEIVRKVKSDEHAAWFHQEILNR